jgi:hypothetical protein
MVRKGLSRLADWWYDGLLVNEIETLRNWVLYAYLGETGE